MDYLIGIDVGTSSTKALLIDPSGKVIKSVAPEYDFYTPKPLWAESDPEDWWAATQTAIKTLIEGIEPSSIAGIGLTGQMHGLVCLDSAGDVLRPCIMWNDQRTAQQCLEMTTRLGGEEDTLALTGNPILPGFTAPKLRWIQENEPEVYSKIAKVLLPKDYIRYKLSGEFFTDVSDASGTSLLDVQQRQWSHYILREFDWPTSWLPTVTESVEASTKLSSQAASLVGLPAGLPIIAGGGDQAAQAVGCGIVSEGTLSTTLGTSGVVFAHSDFYRVETKGRLHAFCHAVPGKWHLMGVMLSAAGSYQWYRNQLCQQEMEQEKDTGVDAYELMNAEAANISPGSEGLLFLPYLSGERTPHPDPNARGSFVGLSLRHTKAHMTRSILEGVSYGLNDSLELMRGMGINPQNMILSGGGAKSPLWRQMLADVFKTPCSLVNSTEGAAYGAALLAGVGAGVYSTVEEACVKTIQTTDTVSPGDNAPYYADFFPRYRNLYTVLKLEFEQMADTLEAHEQGKFFTV